MKKQRFSQSADSAAPANEYDTVFDHPQNSLTHTISKRVKLVISLISSVGTIYLDGKPLTNLGIITNRNWSAALEQATSISTQKI